MSFGYGYFFVFGSNISGGSVFLALYFLYFITFCDKNQPFLREPEKTANAAEIEEQRKQNCERITANTIDYRIPGSAPDRKPEIVSAESDSSLTYARVPKEIMIYIKEIPPVEVGEDGSISLALPRF